MPVMSLFSSLFSSKPEFNDDWNLDKICLCDSNLPSKAWMVWSRKGMKTDLLKYSSTESAGTLFLMVWYSALLGLERGTSSLQHISHAFWKIGENVSSVLFRVPFNLLFIAKPMATERSRYSFCRYWLSGKEFEKTYSVTNILIKNSHFLIAHWRIHIGPIFYFIWSWYYRQK